MNKYNALVILGATATGKTKLATQLAYHFNGEIISADSRQVYKDMDIGTGKDLEDYSINNQSVRHHLIDIVPAGSKYHIHQFKQDFSNAFLQTINNKKLPIICGGSGLYLQACLFDLPFTAVPINSDLRNKLQHIEKQTLLKMLAQIPATIYTPHIDTSSSKRIIRAIEINSWLQNHTLPLKVNNAVTPFVIGLQCDRAVLIQRISNRLSMRLENGLIDEVARLKENGLENELQYYGLEYKFVLQYLQGFLSSDQLQDKLGTAINQFAKRQVTFFKKLEREGLKINWLDAAMPQQTILNEAIDLVTPHFI
ncbi:MAG: tRNA (adenosine(37)-N6)-dimethylallyltransferase MiaA [Bacteroidia bacterium]|nr:tRNA (adenosine(37)-N6)-dimethylallyltransferase MiaA [Bacteroidia bacterium]